MFGMIDSQKKSVLLYHLYPKAHWKKLTLQLLNKVPHEDVFIHVSLDFFDNAVRKKSILSFLNDIPKVRKVFFAKNAKQLSEVVGLNVFRKEINFSEYSILTYMHSKGVTKPQNKNICDWVELMRYFHIDKFSFCKKVFDEGYYLYGVKLAQYSGGVRVSAYKHCDYWYGGNFVSCNLDALRENFLNTPVASDYYGVEGFWGNLCPVEFAFCAHQTPSLYDRPYPEKLYKG